MTSDELIDVLRRLRWGGRDEIPFDEWQHPKEPKCAACGADGEVISPIGIYLCISHAVAVMPGPRRPA